MSREIKFRAWNGTEMGYSPWTGEDPNINRWLNGSRFKIMQYTGLKDKNGVEIYEGDVLRFPEAGENVDVIYNDGAFRLLFSFDDETTVLTEKLLVANYDVEVIGNVHNNPELL